MKFVFSDDSKFIKFCTAFISILMIMITSYLFLLSIFGNCMMNLFIGYEASMYLTDSPFLHISVIILLFMIAYVAGRHPLIKAHLISIINSRYFLWIVHAAVASFMVVAILKFRYQPIADQYYCIKGAQDLLDGNYASWISPGYHYIYPSATSISFLFIPFVALFGMEGASVAFQIFNVAMLMLASRSIYGFCKETRLISSVSSILFILYLPIVFYAFFIYGNVASISLSLFSIWMAVRYFNGCHKRDMFLSAISITLAIPIKTSATVTLMAILLATALIGFFSHEKKLLLWIPVFLLLYLTCQTSIHLLAESLTGEKLSPGMNSYGHLTMGLSEGNRANGWFNDYTTDTLKACNYDFAQYDETTKSDFQQRMQFLTEHPGYSLEFFAKKTASQWNNPTFESIWIQQSMMMFQATGITGNLRVDGKPLNMIFYYMFNIIHSLILFGVLCYFVFNTSNASLPSLIPAITFIGGFLYLLVSEAKAQYTLILFVQLFPYAVSGLRAAIRRGLELPRKKCWYKSKEAVFFILCILVPLTIYFSNTDFINAAIKMGTPMNDAIYNDYLRQLSDAY